MSDTPICDDLAALLALAPGHTFQDRDAWEKLARIFEARLSERDAALARCVNEIENLRNLVTNFADVVEANAFSMPPPNTYTPIFIQFVGTVRNALIDLKAKPSA